MTASALAPVGVVSLLVFTVVPLVVLVVAAVWSARAVYRLEVPWLALLVVVLALMAQHQVLEGVAALGPTGASLDPGQEALETTANLLLAASTYYALSFVREERRALTDLERSRDELHDVEAALRRERDVVDGALDALADVFYVVDAEGRLERWNARVSEVTGYPAADLAGVDVTELVAPADRDRVAASIRTAIETGSAFVEADLVTADGERRRYEFESARLETDDDGWVAGIGRDVTERERIEQDLRRSERRYQNLIEAAPVAINLFDENGTVVWGNDATVDLLGLDSREDLLGRSIFEFITATDQPTAREELTQVITAAESLGPTVMALRRADGERRQVRVSTAPGRYRGERVGQAVAVDVTELRETQSELRAERDFVRKALDELQDVLCVLDGDGRLVRWNARLGEVTGYDDDELDGTHVADLFDPADEPRVREALRTAFDEGELLVDADLLAADGERRHYEFEGARLGGTGGEKRLVAIARDVTEQERMERELRANEQRYRTLVEMSPYPVLVHSEGEIRYANGALADLVGADGPSDLVGEQFTEFLHAAEHDEAVRTAAMTQRGEQAPTGNRRRVVTLDDRVRQIETTSRPIAYEDDPAVLTVLKDVTEQHREETMLRTLHERAREMTRAEDRGRIAEVAVETTDELVDCDGTVVYEYDDGEGLVPFAWSDSLADSAEGIATGRKGESALWAAFVDGEERAFEARAVEVVRDDVSRSLVALPLGNHGVLVSVLEGERSLAASQREALKLVAESLHAALDRAERETRLSERDQRLAEQNETLEQLNRLNEIIREINQALVRSSTRSEVMESVCERLAAADQYAFAWVGSRDAADGEVVLRERAGMDPEYADHLGSTDDRMPLDHLLDAAFREGSVQVAQGVLDDPDWEEYRHTVLTEGYRSVAVVPIPRGEYVEAVLVIHATVADIFDEEERAVLAELGETVGYALRNIERTAAIQSDDRTEVELSIGDERLFTNRLTAGLDATVEFVGWVRAEDDGLELFLRVTDAPAAVAQTQLQTLESVSAVHQVSVEDEAGLYRVTLSIPQLFRILQRNAVRVRTLTAAGGTTTLVAVLPGDVSVRSLVEAVQAAYSGTELVARRGATVPVETRETFRERIVEGLTDRQREALQTAFFSGFYDWPRQTRSEDLAELLGIASSTYQYHLRAAERTVMETLLEPA